MDILKELVSEMQSEYGITKKFMNRYPADNPTYRPHPKSMPIKMLAGHVAEIFAWPMFIMTTDYLDFVETPYKSPEFATQKELEQLLESSYAKGLETLKGLSMEALDGTWDIRQGGMVLQQWSKYGAIRHSFQQITHHRAQLGVYYRLLDISVPASYGPSADENR